MENNKLTVNLGATANMVTIGYVTDANKENDHAFPTSGDRMTRHGLK